MPRITLLRDKHKSKPKRQYTKYTNKYNRFYNDWRKIRNGYYMTHPVDELDLLEGKVNVASDVHHIIPFGSGANDDDKYFLLLNTDNFISLTEDNHHKVHNNCKGLTTKQIQYLKDREAVIRAKYTDHILAMACNVSCNSPL